MTEDTCQIDAWIATYREYNLAHHDARVHAYPGAVDLVHRLRSAGLRLGLVTSKNRVGAVRGLEPGRPERHDGGHRRRR